jgi:glycerate 2-kinase
MTKASPHTKAQSEFMTVKVQNKIILSSKGSSEKLQKARLQVLDSYEAALTTVQPGKLVKSKLVIDGSDLKVDGLVFDLQKFSHVYVVGAGKASGEMASALEELLGKWITKGIVNVPYGNQPKTEKIVLNQASHPLPDQSGVEGAKRMLELAKQSGKDDFVICLISGGGSSLLPLPIEGLTLSDKQEVTQALLRSGADIKEVNIVRKHLSAIKGGSLAKQAQPATVLSLIISDVVGDELGSIASGPTSPDNSTFNDAAEVLKKYNLGGTMPEAVKKIIEDGQRSKIAETPKPSDSIFKKVHNVIIGNNQSACNAVKQFFESQKIRTQLLDAPLEGEASKVAVALAEKIRETQTAPSKPVCIIAGGETTVKVTGKGVGGRNQELALAVALQLRGLEGFVFASLSTDGLDGPTDAAGALIDDNTLRRADQLDLDPEKLLLDNDSYRFFSALEDLVFTGRTGTNVNDLAIILKL